MTLIFALNAALKPMKGKAANAAYPSDELRDAFYKVGIELERAFTIAAHETHSAIQRAEKNMQQKSAQREGIVCPNCKTKNPYGSIFCHSCGTRIAPTEESHGSA